MAKKKKEEAKENKKTGSSNAGRAELAIAMKAVKSSHGDILKWLSDTPDEKFELISTGSISLDSALGGGFPRGRMVEIFGWEGSGKSTLAMSTLAEANKLGLDGLYIDVERALDPRLPVAYGVDPAKFLLEDAPCSAEDHLEIMEALISSGKIGVCVLDSITALMPKAELEGNIGDTHVGRQARLLSQACRKLVQLLGETNTLMIFINQYREKIMHVPGDPKVVSGGNATKFYCTHRVEVSGSGKYKKGRILGVGGEVIGQKMSYNVMKNKISAPWRTGTLDLIYGQGYDAYAEIVNLSIDLGLIEKSGTWRKYKEIKVQGDDKFKLILMEDYELKYELETQVREMLGLKPTVKLSVKSVKDE